MSRQREMNKQKALTIASWFFAGVLVVALVLIAKEVRQYKDSAFIYQSVAESVLKEDLSSDKSGKEKIDFDKLKETNPDAIGWLSCKGTSMNYPVVKGEDNDWYLDHLIDGSKGKAGTLFADCSINDELIDDNTIIYGHNMKDGSMFGKLNKYVNQEYYEKHPVWYFYTPKGDFRIDIVGATFVNESSDAYQINFRKKAEKKEYLKKLKEKSLLKTDIEINKDEQIIMFSTCAYDYEGQRFIVWGKRTRESV